MGSRTVWYKLAHVFQRWRNLIFGCPSHMGVCIVCTYGTPVADVLALSPPLPLVIDYFNSDQDIITEEEGIILALEQRDRVCRIRLLVAVPNLQKFITSIDEEYPMIEYLIMRASNIRGAALTLSESLQAPHLRCLALRNFVLPTGSQLITTAVGIVTFCLIMDHPTTYVPPNTLLQWISFIPQLETFMICFSFPVPNHHVERQPTHTPTITHVTHPNLSSFRFRGVSACLEAVLLRIVTPRLEKFSIHLRSLRHSVRSTPLCSSDD